MKKWLYVLFGALLFTVGLPVAVSANVNNFTISSYDINLTLGRDSENRSVLTTKETITAEFPDFDQNRGIERYIPTDYEGHPMSLEIVSVKNEAGESWKYTTYDSGEYTVLRIGDADKYVRGSQTYAIEYIQRDVTGYFADTQAQEFYWDTNGTEWRVPIIALSVSLEIDESITNSLSGNTACYFGSFGADQTCELSRTGSSYQTSVANLDAGENITIAIGFEPDTFAEYEQSTGEKLFILWAKSQVVGMVVGGLILVYIVARYNRWSKRRHEIGPIVTEFLPPKGASVQVSGVLVSSRTVFAAQLVDLAVRRYINIYEIKAKKRFSKGEYELEILNPITTLYPEEQELLIDIFGVSVAPGSKISTKEFSNDYATALRLNDNPVKLKMLMRENYGLQAIDTAKSARLKKSGLWMLGISILYMNLPLMLVGLVAFLMSHNLYVLTDKGLTLTRYLEGLKLYIQLAEKDRLSMLQSPEGAQKVHVSTDDPKQLVKLYEKVLPYAILFGQEKQWNKQLGSYYESAGVNPSWYVGSSLATFNAANFSSAISDMTSSINSSGAASSGAGGSSGGGSSGGGGGGGGGGGW